jgi:phosphonate transport system substrate-binding protein
MRTLITLALGAVLVAGCGAEGTGGEAATSSGEGGAAHAALTWTAIPDANAESLKLKYDPVSAYLSEKLGVDVIYKPVADYKASVEGFKSGDIQLAWFGGLTGVQAREAVDGANAIAQGAEDPKYKSYFIAHKDTGIEPSEDFPMALADHAFTFGSESSTSGRLMPEYFIRQTTKKGPKEFFQKGFSFSGAHDKTALMVEAGTEVKAGALSYKKYDSMVAKGEIDPEVCRIVWTTPTYEDYNFTAHPRLEEMFGAGFTDKLQAALIGMKDKALLDAFPRSALIPAKNEDFAKIKKTAAELGLVRGDN